MKISFDIVKIEAILSYNFGYDCLDKYVKEPNLKHISPIKRRRLSKSAKSLFASLSGFNLKDTPIVFSSKMGEVNRCFELLGELSSNQMISPTSFSLSVHNATSSQFSIFNKNSCEISAISAQNSLEYGLLDAFLKLDHEVKQVAVVTHFEPIEQDFLNEKGFQVVALIIKKGSDFTLEKALDKNLKLTQNSSIKFLKEYENRSNSWKIADKNFTWHWTYG